jgi:hypothetical protein
MAELSAVTGGATLARAGSFAAAAPEPDRFPNMPLLVL